MRTALCLDFWITHKWKAEKTVGKQAKKEGKTRALRAPPHPLTMHPCVGVRPGGATIVNTVIKPLHWSLLYLSNPQHQGIFSACQAAGSSPHSQRDQTIPNRPAQGKPVMELPAEHWGQVRLSVSSPKRTPAGFTEGRLRHQPCKKLLLPFLSHFSQLTKIPMQLFSRLGITDMKDFCMHVCESWHPPPPPSTQL